MTFDGCVGFIAADREYVLRMCFSPALGQLLANRCGITRQPPPR